MSSGLLHSFKSYTLTGLEQLVPDPRDTIAGRGFLKVGAGCLLTGSTGIGKSVLAEQIAVHVAAGCPILGTIAVPRPQKVLHIQAENDAESLKCHFGGILQGLEIRSAHVEDRLVIDHVYGLSGVELAAYVEQRVKDVEPSLVVFDPYQSYIGEADMNSSHSFLGFISPIARLMQMHRFGILIVAHTAKPRDHNDQNVFNSVYKAAGTSTISNWTRSSCELGTVGRHTNRFKLTFGKNAESAGLPESIPGKTTRELYLKHSESAGHPFWTVSDNQNGPSNSKNEEQIRQYLKQSPQAGDSEVAEAVSCNRTTVYRIRKRLQI